MINWLESFEKQADIDNPFKTNFNEHRGVMDTFLFKGASETRIQANSYLQACEKLVDRLVAKEKLIVDDYDMYLFVELFGADPKEIPTEAKEKPHACALYVKSLTDRKILSYAGME